jgi:Tfp pilus assembly protein PilN
MTDQLTEDYTGTQTAPDPGPPAPLRIAWAPVPKVNLLPIEILESRRFRRTQLMLAGVVVLVALLAGAGTYLAQRSVADANDDLIASQARVTQLQTEQAKFATVPQVIAEVDAATAARTSAMGSDVLWYRYLSDVDGALPAGVTLSAVTFVVNTNATAAGALANPLSSAGVGAITMSGSAGQYDQVATWLEAITKITGFSSPMLSSAAKDDGTVSFSLSAILDTDALSARYTKDAG